LAQANTNAKFGRRTFSVFEKFKQIQVAVDADRKME
jgi:hypothetical protein